MSEKEKEDNLYEAGLSSSGGIWFLHLLEELAFPIAPLIALISIGCAGCISIGISQLEPPTSFGNIVNDIFGIFMIILGILIYYIPKKWMGGYEPDK